MSLTVAAANRVAAEIDTAMNGVGDRALGLASLREEVHGRCADCWEHGVWPSCYCQQRPKNAAATDGAAAHRETDARDAPAGPRGVGPGVPAEKETT